MCLLLFSVFVAAVVVVVAGTVAGIVSSDVDALVFLLSRTMVISGSVVVLLFLLSLQSRHKQAEQVAASAN